MKAVTCPVCCGSGRYEPPKWQPQNSNAVGVVTCHGCDGKGWVAVLDEPITKR